MKLTNILDEIQVRKGKKEVLNELFAFSESVLTNIIWGLNEGTVKSGLEWIKSYNGVDSWEEFIRIEWDDEPDEAHTNAANNIELFFKLFQPNELFELNVGENNEGGTTKALPKPYKYMFYWWDRDDEESNIIFSNEPYFE